VALPGSIGAALGVGRNIAVPADLAVAVGETGGWAASPIAVGEGCAETAGLVGMAVRALLEEPFDELLEALPGAPGRLSQAIPL